AKYAPGTGRHRLADGLVGLSHREGFAPTPAMVIPRVDDSCAYPLRGSQMRSESVDVEALNDQLAREHPSDDYYARSPWPIRFVEGRRLARIREFMGGVAGLDVIEIGSGGGPVLRMFPT